MLKPLNIYMCNKIVFGTHRYTFFKAQNDDKNCEKWK